MQLKFKQQLNVTQLILRGIVKLTLLLVFLSLLVFLLEKIKSSEGDLVDNKYLRFKFLKGDYQINIFFDINTNNIIGWQNTDIYQNLVITYLFHIKRNIDIDKNQFRLPSPTNN